MDTHATAAKEGNGAHEITRILRAIEQGMKGATDQLIPLVYDELRRLAASQLAREKPGQTLQPTALVHEAYLRLIDPEGESWQNRRHFFTAATEAMRRILVESARRKRTAKRGGDHLRVDLDIEALVCAASDVDVLDLNAALDGLAAVDQDSAEIVKLRYFAGLTMDEIASILQVSRRTIYGRWAFAKAWLYRRLREAGPDRP